MIALLLAAAIATPTVTPATPEASPAKSEQQALFDEAFAQYQARDCDAAIPALKTLVATHYRAVESAYALRDCYLAKYKDAAGAVTALEAEVKANPSDSVAHSNLGTFYLLVQKRDESRSELA